MADVARKVVGNFREECRVHVGKYEASDANVDKVQAEMGQNIDPSCYVDLGLTSIL